ncbi:MAG: MarR family transcriptional regulator [Halanaerobium sp. 4-GBenrich]|jgi:DNA-binding MarR family transcriptional regulator|uniref:DNA-binding MarR family transcriptional regulator n=1 Tax=Halanaerobium congolense TaxID=54121 RepID=A0A1G6S080_9FIRM|nr:MarR family transcriptional regulator [Halanaerobium congolense]KXS50128.1 MAG: MarR family transcriptional regulator [Halanaerobium sp. T82-1]ODS50413.1 MAG: MarR family transcriptional regulator [Halanaerobium sp. 4-GBenrich]OEG62910.1 MAG: MarR family transcriptional regulator [Halanaerobium sp. MDAL1]PUU92635.1 MAG: MarR family transcriptional regulator [Halanaerobium sp.]PXV67955.1 DNA-binding MarR family transcriptional regulator [Halanaerobium congolense]
MGNEINNKIEAKIRNIAKYLNEYTKDHLKCYNLTLGRFHVLRVILESEPVSMGDIHEELHMANSTVTVIVDYLYEAGLVKRRRDANDRRVVLLEITDDGNKIMKDLLKQRQDFMKQALAGMEDSAVELASLLENLLNKIEEIY